MSVDRAELKRQIAQPLDVAVSLETLRTDTALCARRPAGVVVDFSNLMHSHVVSCKKSFESLKQVQKYDGPGNDPRKSLHTCWVV